MAAPPQLSAAAARSLNLPEGFRTYSPFPFQGINLQSAGIAIGDQEFTYIENFWRLGDGYLRTNWDVGAALYTTTGPQIGSFFFFNISTTYYCAVFLVDGSAIQVNVATGATTTIGPAGTFGQLPACTQWGDQYLLTSNNVTLNDYWAWDGTFLYQSGTSAPNGAQLGSGGAGYSSAPTITPNGGRGSGLTVTGDVRSGSVVNLNITNPGTNYLPTDTVQLIFTGGGSDNSATLTAHLTAGPVGAVDVIVQGSGYTTASVGFSGGGGSSAAATAIITGGKITGIILTSGGSGYTNTPLVTITGDGTGARAVAYLDATTVNTITVTSSGGGYRYPPLLSIVGGGGSGATAIAVLTATSVAKINVTAGGTGYTSAPTVTIHAASDGGTGATATAIVRNGQVVQINVTAAGSGYQSQPTIDLSGGGGSGAAATVLLTATTINSVLVSNSGQNYTTDPTVEILPGANQAATATVSLWPYGVSGESIETFQQRVWVVNQAPPLFGNIPPGGIFSVSAPESLTDFATSDGGLIFDSTDSFLQTKYVGVRQSNGYLYFFGDGEVAVVSNVQSSGSPVTTTFNYQNVDLQTGLSWRDSRQDFGRSMVFGNETGIYGLYGGSVTKISQKLDKLFDQAVFPPTAGAIVPSGAIATVHEVKHYMQLTTIVDPDTGANRNVLLAWNERDWVVASQTVNLTYIGPQKVSSKFTAWGTDGTSIYPLFQTPSSVLVKRLDTKYYGGDQPFMIKDLQGVWMMAQDLSVDTLGINLSVVLPVSGLASQNENFPSVPSGTYSGSEILYANPSWPAGSADLGAAPPPFYPLWAAGTGGVPFVTIGVRLSSTSPDFSVNQIILGYTPISAVK